MKTATSSSVWNNRDDHLPGNAIDGNPETWFGLFGEDNGLGEDTNKDGFWKAEFDEGGASQPESITVHIISRKDVAWEEAQNAKIYNGDDLCGTMPSEVEESKLYIFNCKLTGEYIKIVTGRNDIDQKLSFSDVSVYANYASDSNEVSEDSRDSIRYGDLELTGTYMKDTIAFDSDGKEKADDIIFLGV